MKKRLHLTVLVIVILCAMTVNSYAQESIEIDGILYRITANKEAMVSGHLLSITPNVIIPDCFLYDSIYYTVTSIGGSAFKDCSSLISIEIPSSVTSIEGLAFYACSSLKFITIPSSVTSIGIQAFSYCSSLPVENDIRYADEYLVEVVNKGNSSYIIRDGTKWIGGKAFSGCSSLISIELPSSVTDIGYYAFGDCSSLITIEVPSSVTDIYSSVFSGCSSLTSVEIPSSVNSIGNSAFYGCSSLTSIVIPSSVTSIGNSAFSGCSSLESITIPSSVTFIGSEAFMSCSNLTSITIPSSITSIGDYAFENCSSLTSIAIPSSVTDIGAGAFSGCSSIPAENGIRYIDSYLVEVVNKDNSSYIIRDGTKWIGGKAFSGCSSLISIELPSSVTLIDYQAFKDCRSLTSIEIPSSVTSIGEKAFSGCESLPVENNIRYADEYLVEVVNKDYSSYTIKDGTKWIGGKAFSGCSSLTSITIPSSVTSIFYYAFEDCSGLTSIEIPSSVTDIGYYAFEDCSSLPVENGIRYADEYLVEVVNKYNSYYCIKEGTKWIGDKAFMGCSSMTSIEVPSSVNYIGEWAFSGCGSLTSITIPSSVTDIEYEAFIGCTSLQFAICCSQKVPKIFSSLLFPLRTAVYVPDKAYMDNKDWNSYDLRLINQLEYSEFVYSSEVPTLEFTFSDLFTFDYSIDSLKAEVGEHRLKTVISSELMPDTLVLYTDYKINADPLRVETPMNDKYYNEPLIYDMTGRSVRYYQGMKGLFIVNGRKTLLR